MLRDPRAVFDTLFGAGATPEERARRRREDKSILDTIVASIDRLKRQLGAADRARLTDYLDDVREIERRIQNVEATNRSGETARAAGRADGRARLLRRARQADVRPAGAGAGVGHHARVRVQAVARRVGPRLPGDRRHAPASTTRRTTTSARSGSRTSRRSTRYHVSLVPYFLERLKKTPDGDGNLLDNTLIIYGSPMGNPNVHNHKRCPLFLAGNAGGQLKGGLHLKAADGTPMANVFLTMAHMLGMDDCRRSATAPASST